MVVRDWKEGGMGVTANAHKVYFWGDENILELYSGNGCMILRIY